MYPKKGGLNLEYIRNSYKPERQNPENPIEKIGKKVEQIFSKKKKRYLKDQLTKDIDGHLNKEEIQMAN